MRLKQFMRILSAYCAILSLNVRHVKYTHELYATLSIVGMYDVQVYIMNSCNCHVIVIVTRKNAINVKNEWTMSIIMFLAMRKVHKPSTSWYGYISQLFWLFWALPALRVKSTVVEVTPI